MTVVYFIMKVVLFIIALSFVLLLMESIFDFQVSDSISKFIDNMGAYVLGIGFVIELICGLICLFNVLFL